MARVAVALTCTAEICTADQRGELLALARSRTEEARLAGTGQDCFGLPAGQTERRGLACGRIRWVCGASGLRQLGWPGCGIGRGRARPPNLARICAYGFCANWNCRRPRGWPVGMGLQWPQRRAPRTMRSGACCAGKASNCAGGAPGASAPTHNLPPSLPLARTGGRRYYRPLPEPAGKTRWS